MQPIREAKEQKYVKPTREGLFIRQKEILETFFAHGAISEEEYTKSLKAITLGMAG